MAETYSQSGRPTNREAAVATARRACEQVGVKLSRAEINAAFAGGVAVRKELAQRAKRVRR